MQSPLFSIWDGACCSLLQCVAICCSMLQCVAVCCSMLQHVAVSCTTHVLKHIICIIQASSSNLSLVASVRVFVCDCM